MLDEIEVAINHHELIKVKISAADRDEKIRVSAFPESYVIEGFLLGHGAYITSMDLSPKNGLVVSCGADRYLRVWDIHTMKQIAELSVGTVSDNSENKSSRALLTDLLIFFSAKIGLPILPTNLASNF